MAIKKSTTGEVRVPRVKPKSKIVIPRKKKPLAVGARRPSTRVSKVVEVDDVVEETPRKSSKLKAKSGIKGRVKITTKPKSKLIKPRGKAGTRSKTIVVGEPISEEPAVKSKSKKSLRPIVKSRVKPKTTTSSEAVAPKVVAAEKPRTKVVGKKIKASSTKVVKPVSVAEVNPEVQSQKKSASRETPKKSISKYPSTSVGPKKVYTNRVSQLSDESSAALSDELPDSVAPTAAIEKLEAVPMVDEQVDEVISDKETIELTNVVEAEKSDDNSGETDSNELSAFEEDEADAENQLEAGETSGEIQIVMEESEPMPTAGKKSTTEAKAKRPRVNVKGRRSSRSTGTSEVKRVGTSTNKTGKTGETKRVKPRVKASSRKHSSTTSIARERKVSLDENVTKDVPAVSGSGRKTRAGGRRGKSGKQAPEQEEKSGRRPRIKKEADKSLALIISLVAGLIIIVGAIIAFSGDSAPKKVVKKARKSSSKKPFPSIAMSKQKAIWASYWSDPKINGVEDEASTQMPDKSTGNMDADRKYMRKRTGLVRSIERRHTTTLAKKYGVSYKHLKHIISQGLSRGWKIQ